MINDIFAVVDLETTGTSVKNDDRIIQFSCSFVKNNRVINNYNTYINPEMDIPQRITKLTGINNNTIQFAPTFNQIANKITKILKGTIFVAHNVNFDFPFLNAELKKNGFKKLNIKAIDTVTLSQILLPTIPSYRLRDISIYFNIIHKHPHSSDSDALATAKLLIIIMNLIYNLPIYVINQIIKLHPFLPQNTLDVFKWAQKYHYHYPKALPSYLFKCHHLILRKINIHRNDNFNHVNINNNSYHQSFNIKPIVNKIHRHYRNNISIEMPDFFKRMLATTYPMSKIINKYHQKLIISLASQNNIKTFMEQIVPYLKIISPFKINAVHYLSYYHYIDLLKFYNSLFMPNHNKLDSLTKAKILVWLTITKTGNMDELNLDINRDQYLNEIKVQKFTFKRSYNPFAKFDFIKLRNRKIKNANLIIINQKSLINNDLALINTNKSYLVADQAQMLPDQINKANHLSIDFGKIIVIIHQIKNILNRTHHKNLRDVFKYDQNALLIISKINKIINQIEIKINSKMDKLNHLFNFQSNSELKMNQCIIKVNFKNHQELTFIHNFFITIFKKSIQIERLSHQLSNVFSNFHRLSKVSEFIVNQYQNELVNLEQIINPVRIFIQEKRQIVNKNISQDKIKFDLKINQSLNPNTISITYQKNNSLTLKKITNQFKNYILSGSSLYLVNQNNELESNLKIDSNRLIQSNSYSDYSKCMRMFFINDHNLSNINKLTNSLNHLINDINELTFININDLRKINNIYELMVTNQRKNVLSEQISGTDQKITKIIKSSPNSIVIGDIDLFQNIKWGDHKLKTLILLYSDNYNPITNMLAAKQIINEFIMITQNNGIIILDSHYLKYYQILINSLSSNISYRFGTINQINNYIKMFSINN